MLLKDAADKLAIADTCRRFKDDLLGKFANLLNGQLGHDGFPPFCRHACSYSRYEAFI